ncbi:LOW QUALITY PROTEIN: uncharacterized protein LOC117612512 [Prunus dulcis]|uniref:LOW QUALITY PROTEIN: uncharacterized protein LOC117612512 n=1 Tax=Prunus dulcis TaxID=3755 RepID=UPI001483A44A|nr:LOW QUALITY PROTEIN: uncharacterized protein LOC117612512 [Prunus dulcis]
MEDSGVSVSVTVFPPAMGSSPPVPHLVAFVSVACPKVLRSSPGLCQKSSNPLKVWGRGRQVVPEVVHAHLEELLRSKLLGTGKSRGSPPCNELRDRFMLGLECSGTPTLLCVLLNCFLNSETLASQVGIDCSERWAYRVKAGPSNDCMKSLRHSAPFCATGPHLTRKCARCWRGSPRSVEL